MGDDASIAEEAVSRANDAMAVGDPDTAVANLSAAIRHFTTAGELCDAAMACVRLGDVLGNFLGNLTAARVWFLRAERLVADLPHCLEQGWVAVAAMGCDVDDPADLLRRAELALDRARRFGDVNLETKALADAGLAHVQAGRVEEGMALLDEAMALACGAADDVDATGKSICSFFTACYFAADFERAGTWSDSLRHRGLIGNNAPTPLFLSSHCDSVQATLLLELGRWSEAEALLAKAILDFETTLSIPSWHPAIALADLRIRQGRLADAEALLLGKDGHLQALLPAAQLHLARGDFDLAIALAPARATPGGRRSAARPGIVGCARRVSPRSRRPRPGHNGSCGDGRPSRRRGSLGFAGAGRRGPGDGVRRRRRCRRCALGTADRCRRSVGHRGARPAS